MVFNYEESMAIVNRELETLVERLWTKFYPPEVQALQRTVENKASTIINDIGGQVINIDSGDRGILLLLNEIVYGSFWHSSNFWKNAEAGMTDHDRELYATITIEQAKRAHTMKEMSAPGYWYGYSWIVEKYDQGELRDYIPESLLREAVNRGFWEYANRHFTVAEAKYAMPGGILDRYYIVMKYWEYLDLTRVNEFWKEPLCGKADWPILEYRKAFGRVMRLLNEETAAKLASPIIDGIFRYVLNDEHKWDEKRGAEVAERLKPYERYMKLGEVQELIRSNLVEQLGYLYDDDYKFEALRNVNIYLDYLDMDANGKAGLVSTALNPPKEGKNAIEDLVELRFPVSLLTKEKKRELRKALQQHLGLMAKFMFNPRAEAVTKHEQDARRSVEPASGIKMIELAQDAMKMGLLGRDWCRSFIERQIGTYLKTDALPSKSKIEAWKGVQLGIKIDASLHTKFLRKVDEQGQASEQRSNKAMLRANERVMRERQRWLK
jgi:hypothetical protein